MADDKVRLTHPRLKDTEYLADPEAVAGWVAKGWKTTATAPTTAPRKQEDHNG